MLLLRPHPAGRGPLIVTSIAGLVVLASFIPWVDQRTSIRAVMDALTDPSGTTRWPLALPIIIVGVVAAFLALRFFRDRAAWSAWRMAILAVLVAVTILTDFGALQERYGVVSGTVPIVLMMSAVVAIAGLERMPKRRKSARLMEERVLYTRETINRRHYQIPTVRDQGGIPQQTPGWIDHERDQLAG